MAKRGSTGDSSADLRPEACRVSLLVWPALPGTPKALTPAANLQALADQLLLQTYSPAAVLVNNQGDILYISGRTGKYLEPAAGKANWNIFAMAREGLRYELTRAFRKALRQKDAVTVKNVTVRTNGGAQAVDLTVQTIREPEALRGLVMIVFADVPTPPDTKPTGKARRGLPAARCWPRWSRNSNKPARRCGPSAKRCRPPRRKPSPPTRNLQSTNEELQSTNEELTTSKEEMQSMNEELQTVNHELQAKVDESVASINNDMKNLIDSTEIATLFLDDALRVRLFTTGANKLFKLIPGDVGRPITDIASDLDYPELAEDAREVLRTLVFREQQVATRDGRWFAVRIMPYRTLEGMSGGGVVITFTDITVSKSLEAQLRQTQAGLETHIVEQDVKLEQADAKLKAETRRGRAVKGAGEGPRSVKTPEGDQ